MFPCISPEACSFLMFSGGTEREHWSEIWQQPFSKFKKIYPFQKKDFELVAYNFNLPEVGAYKNIPYFL